MIETAKLNKLFKDKMDTTISHGVSELLALDSSLAIVETTNIEGIKCVAIVIQDMEIVDPYRSKCGRFEVDSRASYGLTPEIADRLVQINQDIRARDRSGTRQRPV